MKIALLPLALCLFALPANAIDIAVHWGFGFDEPWRIQAGYFFADQAPDGTISNITGPYVHNYAAYTLSAFSVSSDFVLDPLQSELSFILTSATDIITFSVADGVVTEQRTSPQSSFTGPARSNYLFVPEGSPGVGALGLLALAGAAMRKRLTSKPARL